MNTPVAARAKTAAPWALGVFAVLFVLFFFRALPLELDPVRTTNTPDQFDAERAISRLSNILDGTPHPVDSASLDETRARLMQEIRSLGYSPELRAANVCQALSGGVTGNQPEGFAAEPGDSTYRDVLRVETAGSGGMVLSGDIRPLLAAPSAPSTDDGQQTD